METGVQNYKCVSYFKEATLQQTCSTLQQSLIRDSINKTPSGQWSSKTHVYRRLRKPRCNIMQLIATPWHCNVCKLSQMWIWFEGSQHNFYLATVQTTTDCNTLQHAATHYNTARLHHTATYRTYTTTDLIHKHKRALYTLKRPSHTPNIRACIIQYTPQSNEPFTNILICTPKHTTKHTHSRARTHTRTRTRTRTHVHTRARTHIHTRTHTYVHTHTHTHTHTHMPYYTFTSEPWPSMCVCERETALFVCVCARVCVCVCVCNTDTRQWRHDMLDHQCVCLYVCVCVCVCVCILYR